jgi:hypothetical protein
MATSREMTKDKRKKSSCGPSKKLERLVKYPNKASLGLNHATILLNEWAASIYLSLG